MHMYTYMRAQHVSRSEQLAASVGMCVYIGTYIHTCMHTHTYMNACIHTHLFTGICIYMHGCVCVFVVF